MKFASILILWSATMLPAKGLDRPDRPRPDHQDGLHVATALSLIHRPADASTPDDPNGPGAGASLWDEEDSSDDDLSHAAPLPPSFSDARERVGFASQPRSPGRARRAGERLTPLRC